MTQWGLEPADQDLILRRDWRGLIHRGVTFFVLEKLGAVVGAPNLAIYAHMKGLTLEEMIATRNAGITYSVAAKTTEDAG